MNNHNVIQLAQEKHFLVKNFKKCITMKIFSIKLMNFKIKIDFWQDVFSKDTNLINKFKKILNFKEFKIANIKSFKQM